MRQVAVAGTLLIGVVVIVLSILRASEPGSAQPLSGPVGKDATPPSAAPSVEPLTPVVGRDARGEAAESASARSPGEVPPRDDGPGPDENPHASEPAWYVSRLRGKLGEFRAAETVKWQQLHALIVSAAVASLELRGLAVEITQRTPNHEFTTDHVCVSQYTQQGGYRRYCITRAEFPEYFEVMELRKAKREFLAPISVPDTLASRVEGRAAAVMALFD